jgi:hypothetical protein
MDARRIVFAVIALAALAGFVLGALLWPAAPEASVEAVLLLVGVLGLLLIGGAVGVSHWQERRR